MGYPSYRVSIHCWTIILPFPAMLSLLVLNNSRNKNWFLLVSLSKMKIEKVFQKRPSLQYLAGKHFRVVKFERKIYFFIFFRTVFLLNHFFFGSDGEARVMRLTLLPTLDTSASLLEAGALEAASIFEADVTAVRGILFFVSLWGRGLGSSSSS